MSASKRLQDEELQQMISRSFKRRVRKRVQAHRLRREVATRLLRREIVEQLYEYCNDVRVSIARRFSSAVRRVAAATSGPHGTTISPGAGLPMSIELSDDEVAEMVLCAHCQHGVRPARAETSAAFFRACPSWRLKAIGEFIATGRTIRQGLDDRWFARRGHKWQWRRAAPGPHGSATCHQPPAITPSAHAGPKAFSRSPSKSAAAAIQRALSMSTTSPRPARPHALTDGDLPRETDWSRLWEKADAAVRSGAGAGAPGSTAGAVVTLASGAAGDVEACLEAADVFFCQRLFGRDEGGSSAGPVIQGLDLATGSRSLERRRASKLLTSMAAGECEDLDGGLAFRQRLPSPDVLGGARPEGGGASEPRPRPATAPGGGRRPSKALHLAFC